jgi:hypothetical protein
VKFAQVVGVFPGPKFDDAAGGAGSPAGKKFTMMVVEWEFNGGSMGFNDAYTYLYHTLVAQHPYLDTNHLFCMAQDVRPVGIAPRSWESLCGDHVASTGTKGLGGPSPKRRFTPLKCGKSTMKVDHFPNAVS